MAERFYWCVTNDVDSIVRSIELPEDTLMMLERIPDRWLSEPEREVGICFHFYQADEEFNNWERGRVFNEKFELRWEKQNGKFHVVYIGEKSELPNLSEDTSIKINQMESKDMAYYLWGKKLDNEALRLIGRPETENLFAELQIPRLFDYPIEKGSDKEFRVKLVVRHYSVHSTLNFYRFLKLEAEK